MSGKWLYSSTDSSAVPTRLRELNRQQKEIAPSIAKSLAPVLSYLTQGSGYQSNYALTTINGTAPTTNNAPQLMPFDSNYDLDIAIETPLSGSFSATITAWVNTVANIYTLTTGNGQPANLYFRAGIVPHAYTGNTEPDATGLYGGAQLANRVYNSNLLSEIALTTSTSVQYWGSTPGEVVHVRTRRWYWAYYADPANNKIGTPAGSWYRAVLGECTMQLAPVYTNTHQQE